VAVTVNPVNDAPSANDSAASGDEDTTITGTVSGSDLDGDALTFAKASDPASGTVTLNGDGSFSYVPNTNFAGSDSFTFVANDGTTDSAPATVTLTVNDQPEAALTVADASIDEGNTGTQVLTFTVTVDREPDTGVTVHYATADGTATAGSDYVAAAGNLSFGPGQPLTQT